jgi:hypothetical protein
VNIAKVRVGRKFRLEDHLILAPFIAHKLGIHKISGIRSFNDVQDGFDSNGRSYMFHRIVSRGGLQIAEDKLREYDDNIRVYVDRLSRNRGELIQLKYFQYLAILFMEVYLDEYFTNQIDLINHINVFQRERELMPKKPFGKGDLRKLAFWMATGSGKTILMHVNLWQLQKYNKGSNATSFDNIFLITPNEGLSDQHVEEMRLSGIPAMKFRGGGNGYFLVDDSGLVKVIEITKLKLPEDKKGEGETIDVTELGDRNLVLVDEGHKGQKSEDRKWMRVREELAKKGFTLEYSATFGQVIREEKGGEPSGELITYSKAILFDYSYKYFHSDGYGKDFRLLNLEDDHDRHTESIMLANAISFYEQLRVFKDLGVRARDYNIEQPLWIFLGHKVQEDESDLLVVLRFFCKVLENKDGWVNKRVKDLLDGKSGLLIGEGDAFAKRKPENIFPYLREKDIPADEVVNGIFSDIFGLQIGAGRKLHLVDIKRAEGELGLKASTAPIYFGVINIGDKAKFRDHIEKTETAIVVDNDVMTESLFDSIQNKDTKLNVLIGAKKFIEGWNCWRVSTMGLMNVGKGEGPQIIQLFGRGVRLKGKGMGLKRSRALSETDNPPFIEVLETLGIFGIKANYLSAFREMLELEEVKSYVSFPLEIKTNVEMLKGLKILRLRKGADFGNECTFSISEVNDVWANLNLLPKVKEADSREAGSIIDRTSETDPKLIPKKYLELIDWAGIYLEMLSYRVKKQWFNISFTKNDLESVIHEEKYTLFAPISFVNPVKEFKNMVDLENIVLRLLKNYLEKCYNRKRNEWEKSNFELTELTESDDNFPKEYVVKVEESAKGFIQEAKKRIASGVVYSAESSDDPLPNIFYENHLYQPLLAKAQTDQVLFHHTGLIDSEQRFVKDLAKYITENSADEGDDAEYYLLRNLTRGRGIGFFETRSFYPDFILWIKREEHQKIIFIEPHGMIHSEGINDPKTNLHRYLKEELEPALGNDEVSFDSFTISVTDLESFISSNAPRLERGEYCFEHHLLFMEVKPGKSNVDYIKEMIKTTENKDSR